MSADDERKLDYTREAVGGVNPFAAESPLDAVVEEVFPWLAARNAEQIMAEREAMLVALEKAAKLMRCSGAGDKWFEGCDPRIRKVCLCWLGCVLPCWDFLRPVGAGEQGCEWIVAGASCHGHGPCAS